MRLRGMSFPEDPNFRNAYTTFGQLYLWGNAARIHETGVAQRPAVVAHLMTESDVGRTVRGRLRLGAQ